MSSRSLRRSPRRRGDPTSRARERRVSRGRPGRAGTRSASSPNTIVSNPTSSGGERTAIGPPGHDARLDTSYIVARPFSAAGPQSVTTQYPAPARPVARSRARPGQVSTASSTENYRLLTGSPAIDSGDDIVPDDSIRITTSAAWPGLHDFLSILNARPRRAPTAARSRSSPRLPVTPGGGRRRVPDPRRDPDRQARRRPEEVQEEEGRGPQEVQEEANKLPVVGAAASGRG